MKLTCAASSRLRSVCSPHNRFLSLSFALLVTATRWLGAAETADSSRWEKEIAAFESRDRTNMPPKQAFLFVGSSSIRMWKTLEKDFAGLPVISRGFGGSQMIDAVRYVERIVVPYEPKMVLVYAGDNDLAAKKKPAEVLQDFKTLVAAIHQRLPQTRVAFIAIKPSVARKALLPEIKAANRDIQAYTSTDPRLAYIDVFTPMLDQDGQPRGELLVEDGLHLNSNGYELWTGIIKPYLK